MINNSTFLEMMNATVQRVTGRVEVYSGSTLAATCNADDKLQDIKVERVGESKFFGYGVSQRLTTTLIDINRELNITKEHHLKAWYGVKGEFLTPYPNFYVDEITRDENTNALTITAFDAVGLAANHTVAELQLAAPYTIKQFAEACAALLGLQLRTPTEEVFSLSYAEGANFNGNETIREALNGIAEVSQTIYYIDKDGYLVFKRLSKDDPVATIDKEKYMELKSEPAVSLKGIAHITQLGDNVAASLPNAEGDIHYIRDNPFLELREDVGEILENALTAINGLVITPFTCSWWGNCLIEIGDAIQLQAKDDSYFTSFLINDTTTFKGGTYSETKWSYQSNENAPTNPSTLGDKLNETFAKVDKVNQQIDLVVRSNEATQTALTQLQLNLNGINATVEQTQQRQEQTDTALGLVNDDIEYLTNKVEAAITADQVNIQIKEELQKGTDKVITATGFVFDDTGLTVSKTGSEMTTSITEDGMIVYKNDEAVLNANNRGVDAKNLHATTYLIIGTNSRFEDYGSRTACFYIGG